LAAKKNYYAVKSGRQPGIYKTWAACQKQVAGFKGALFKGFVTRDEAESYMGSGRKDVAASAAYEPGCTYIFVDGSYFHGRYSWGLAVYLDGQLLDTANGVGTSKDAAKLHNVAGEVEGAVQAVHWAEAHKLEKFVICHDYIGISEWAERRWKTNTQTTADYAAFMAPYLGWVRFRKVAGHTGVAGNELADRLAKKALDI
jgi:ribonuclease HI